MRTRITVLLFAAIALVASLATPASGLPEDATALSATELGNNGPSADLLEYYVTVRSSLAFDASKEHVLSILKEYGEEPEHGYPLTPAEQDELSRRLNYQYVVGDKEIAFFSDLPGFAGFFFDHSNGGRPTVLATDPWAAKAAIEQEIERDVADNVTVRRAEYSWTELTDLVDQIAGAQPGPEFNSLDRSEVLSVGVRVADNAVEVSVATEDAAESVFAAIGRTTTVPLEVVVTEAPSDDVCTSRWNCYSPLKAGVGITGNTGGSSTLGFGIKNPSDEQYLVSGHNLGTSFTHPPLSVGSVYESLYYDYGFDAKAITASDSQVSNKLYVSSTYTRSVVGYRNASSGLYVCMSGLSSGVRCGNVTDTYEIWVSNTTGYHMQGAVANYYAASGDSGGPVYQYLSNNRAYAVGLHAHSSGSNRYFAKIGDVLAHLGASLVTN
jgi:hypothetical protein